MSGSEVFYGREGCCAWGVNVLNVVVFLWQRGKNTLEGHQREESIGQVNGRVRIARA